MNHWTKLSPSQKRLLIVVRRLGDDATAEKVAQTIADELKMKMHNVFLKTIIGEATGLTRLGLLEKSVVLTKEQPLPLFRLTPDAIEIMPLEDDLPKPAILN